MNSLSQKLLESFERLPENEKQQFVVEILRSNLNTKINSLTDEELTLSSESLFLSLDEWGPMKLYKIGQPWQNELLIDKSISLLTKNTLVLPHFIE